MKGRSPRQALRPLLFVLALGWVPFVVLWAVDLDVVWVAPSALAFLPYAVLGTSVVLIAALVARARVAAMVAAVGLAVLIVPRAERVVADEQPLARGPELIVATSNVLFGDGDAEALMRLVREERIDVLALQEDTPAFTARAEAAGLSSLLPHDAAHPEPGARGTSVYSRYPLREIPPADGDLRSSGGVITLPGGTGVQVRSVHPPPPFNAQYLDGWKRRIAVLPGPADAGVPTVLAGDYNATLDHHPLRRLLARGYRDAAEQTGDAWRPTWSGSKVTTLTIDHVLVPRGVAVEGVTIHHLPGSDHDVVVSRLRLPR
ncbi:MAG: endonuclease/exonuclease/phosphatase family protein [Solirubrobacteraceae bacterium]|nr:endonuclease/exonuclease/phosphatase family protein [Solirubrobacteraceae bacterium]